MLNNDGATEDYAKLLVGMANRVTQLERATSRGGAAPTASVPTGSFIMGGWSTAPDGYLILDGTTIVGGATTYPDLAAVFPAWVSGANLILPNATGAVPLAAASAGAVAGSMSHTLTSAQLPSHAHSMSQHAHTAPNHQHSEASHSHSAPVHQHGIGVVVTVSGGGHTHTVPTPSGSAGAASGSAVNARIGSSNATTSSVAHSHTADVSASIGNSPAANTGSSNGSGTGFAGGTATSTDGSTATGSIGSGSAVDHTPRNLTVRMAVKT